MEKQKVVRLNRDKGNAASRNQGNLSGLVEGLLKKADYPYRAFEDCIGVRVRGKNTDQELLIFAIDINEGFGKVEIINPNYKGINLNEVDDATRHEILELAMKFNSEHFLANFGLVKDRSIMLMAEVPVIGGNLTMEQFMLYFEAVWIVGDELSMEFDRIISHGKNQIEERKESRKDIMIRMNSENIGKVMDEIAYDLSLFSNAHKALVRVLNKKGLLTVQEIVDESKLMVKEAQANKAALN